MYWWACYFLVQAMKRLMSVHLEMFSQFIMVLWNHMISSYVEFIRTYTPIFSALYVHFGTFSDITLVFVVITFWFTADHKIIIHSFVWYRFEIHLSPSTDPQEAVFTRRI